MGGAQSIEPPVVVDYDREPNFTNADGLHLYTRCWPATCQPVRGLIFLSHGLCEHSGRPGYEMLGRQLADLGVTVIAHDHVGHGRSQGIRQDVADFGVYVRDVVQHIEWRREDFGNVPIFLMGHSMGATVALLTAMENPELIQGVIMSAPGLEPFPHQSGFSARYLLPLVASASPHFRVARPADDHLLSRDEEQLAILRADPFYLTRGTKARWAYAYLKALGVLQENMANMKFPFFIAHGQSDHMTNIAGSRHLMERAPSTDKTLKEIPDAVHSLLHEVKECREEVLLYFSDWLETRLKKWEEQNTAAVQTPSPDVEDPTLAAANVNAMISAGEESCEKGTDDVMAGDTEESRQAQLIDL